ncbi:MAG: tRNA (cytidine(56)-2'-O)-methyltransferase [Nanoarchaeota archaeon]
MQIEILRLNHRIARDKRITTHVGLTSRSLGASAIYYSGDKDSEMESSIDKITEKFGGPFKIEHIKNEIQLIKDKKKQGYTISHLTMYGLSFEKYVKKLQKEEKQLIIVGGEKVEPEYYQLSDYNISVTSQPISEVSALGIFLYSIHGIKEEFDNAKIKVIEQERGKLLKEF